MELRGIAESAQCPRCGERMPPDGQRLLTCAKCKLAFDPSKRTSRRPHRRRTPEDVPFGVEWTRDSLILRADNAFAVGLTFLLAAVAAVTAALADDSVRFLGYVAIPLVLLAIPFTAPITIRVDANHVTRRVWPLWTRRFAREDIAGYRTIKVRHENNTYWQVHAFRRGDPDRTHGLCAMHREEDASVFVQMLVEAEKAFPPGETRTRG